MHMPIAKNKLMINRDTEAPGLEPWTLSMELEKNATDYVAL